MQVLSICHTVVVERDASAAAAAATAAGETPLTPIGGRTAKVGGQSYLNGS